MGHLPRERNCLYRSQSSIRVSLSSRDNFHGLEPGLLTLHFLTNQFYLLQCALADLRPRLLQIPIHMPPTKRALLIASPFENLKGPVQDVGTMTNILRRYGFDDITRCSATEATRTRILREWEEMVDRTMSDDIVVFYF
jgi:hypothetical protein